MSNGQTSARREEILTTAADLFWAKGYGSTAMSELAAALGMQKASLYHHVPAKETLLYDLSVESLRHIVDAANTSRARDPVDRLRVLIERHVETLLGEQSRHAASLTELRALSPAHREHVIALRDRYEQIVDEAIREAQVATGLWPGVTPKLLRLALLGMLNWTVFWYRPQGAETPTDIARAFTSVFLAGLPPAPSGSA